MKKGQDWISENGNRVEGAKLCQRSGRKQECEVLGRFRMGGEKEGES